MSFKIKLLPVGFDWQAEKNETLLASALTNNIALDHSCGTGQCGACRTKVLDGSIQFEDQFSVLSDEERAAGVVLSCTAIAQSDVTIQAEYYPELAAIVKRTVPCKVAKIAFPTDDVATLTLRLPPTARFIFLPGQFIDLTAQGITRSYSIASAAVMDNQLELHIRRVPGGQFSELVFTQLKPEQLLRMHGPHGSFFVRNNSKPIIFLAGGTGFASVKAMVEGLISQEDNRPLYVYWGQRTANAIYSDLPAAWAKQYAHIQTRLVVSDDATWQGRKGLVHEAVIDDFADLSGYTVYACGSPLMISAAKAAFIQHGLSAEMFHADAFVPAVTTRG